MSRKILGLDIRTASATAVLMETSLKKCAVTGYVHAPFGNGDSYQERLADALSTVSEKMDLKDCICALSIPSNRFFYRNISVPFSETKKIQQVLPFELESSLPFPVEELLIDFSKIRLSGAEGETRIIAAGIETSQLKSLIDTMESSGVSSAVVFPCGYAAAAWLCTRDISSGSVLYLDFDGEHCCLYLLINGKISLIRSFPLPPAQVESAFHLWGHIQRSVAGFESLFEVKVSPNAIIINGFLDDQFAKQLETVSSLSVETLHVQLPSRCEIQNVDRETFTPRSCFNDALSCALSLLEGFKVMNFRKGPLAATNRLEEYRTRLIRISAIAAALFLLWIGASLTEIHITQKKVNQIDSRILSIFKKTFPDVADIVDPVHQMRTGLDTLKESAFGSAENASQVRAIDLLRDISGSIPDNVDVRFSQLNFDTDDIYIKGTTTSFNLANEIKSKIENINSVASVELSSPKRDGDAIIFTLNIETRQEEAP